VARGGKKSGGKKKKGKKGGFLPTHKKIRMKRAPSICHFPSKAKIGEKKRGGKGGKGGLSAAAALSLEEGGVKGRGKERGEKGVLSMKIITYGNRTRKKN